MDVRSWCRIRTLLVAALLLVTGPESSGVSADEPTLTDAQHRQILDKPKLAQDAYQRARGLLKDGNPHLPIGSILRDAEFAEPRDDERRVQMRARRQSLYGNRILQWVTRETSQVTEFEPEVDELPVSEVKSTLFRNLVFLAFVILAGALYRWRPRRRASR